MNLIIELSGFFEKSQLIQFILGCPGIEPGTSRMKVGFLVEKKEFSSRTGPWGQKTSSQTVRAAFVAHGFLYVI
jgi:hypothetical protein